MKHFSELNHYALLEVSHDASSLQIKQAYEMMKRTYANDSMATYSLMDDESRENILRRIEEAYVVLSDERRRLEYDTRLGLKSANEKTGSEKPHVPKELPAVKIPQTASESHPQERKQRSSPAERPDLSKEEITGVLLQKIREHQGIPLQEIADKTRINITYLQYIEKDRYQSLPAEVYLRGYLEQYARFLGLDPSQIIERFLDRCRGNGESKAGS